MNKKMKYAVMMTKDYTAKLYAGRVGTRIGMIAKADLDSSLPLNHGKQRDIVDNLLRENNITALSFDTQMTQDGVTIIHGEFINYKSPEQKAIAKADRKTRKQRMAMLQNENGFTLIELVVACAIIATLSAVALPHYMSLIESVEAKAEQFEIQNQNSQAELDALLNGLN